MPPAAATDPDGAARFQALWRRCLVSGGVDEGRQVHRRVLDGYHEPQRYYHGFEHIRHCLGMFDACRGLAENPDALELAVWFHDVVFEPGQGDNEARSAALYLELSATRHAPETRDPVERLIMATVHDGSSQPDTDARLMVDIDLSSFGLPWDEFLRDSENLRREASHLRDAEFFSKALCFHGSLQSRERFFQTDFFAERYERQARDNLERYLAHVAG